MFSIIENFFNQFTVSDLSLYLFWTSLIIIGYTAVVNIINRKPFGLLAKALPAIVSLIILIIYNPTTSSPPTSFVDSTYYTPGFAWIYASFACLPIGIILYFTNKKYTEISKSLIFGSFWGLFYWIFLIDWYLIITQNDFGIIGLPNEIMGVFWNPIILILIAFSSVFLTPRIFRFWDIEKAGEVIQRPASAAKEMFTQRINLIRFGTIFLVSFLCFLIFWNKHEGYLNKDNLDFTSFSAWIWSGVLMIYEMIIIIKEFIISLIITPYILLMKLSQGNFTDLWEGIKENILYVIPWISIPLISWGVRIKYMNNILVLVKYKFIEKLLLSICFIGSWIYWSFVLNEINPITILLKINTLHFLVGLSIGFIISFIISKADPSFLTHFTPTKKLYQSCIKSSLWGAVLNIIMIVFISFMSNSSIVDAMFMYLYIILGTCLILIFFLPGRVRVWDMEKFTQNIHLARIGSICFISVVFFILFCSDFNNLDIGELLFMKASAFVTLIVTYIIFVITIPFILLMNLFQGDSIGFWEVSKAGLYSIITLISIPLVSWIVRIKYMKNVLVLVKYRFIEKTLISLCFISPWIYWLIIWGRDILNPWESRFLDNEGTLSETLIIILNIFIGLSISFIISLIVYKVYPAILMHFNPKRKLYQGCLRSSLRGLLLNSIMISFIIMSMIVGVVDAMFNYLYILLVISILFIFIAEIYHGITKSVNLGMPFIKKMLITIIPCIFAVLISYVLAEDTLRPEYIKYNITPIISKLVSAGIILVLILVNIALLISLYFGAGVFTCIGYLFGVFGFGSVIINYFNIDFHDGGIIIISSIIGYFIDTSINNMKFKKLIYVKK